MVNKYAAEWRTLQEMDILFEYSHSASKRSRMSRSLTCMLILLRSAVTCWEMLISSIYHGKCVERHREKLVT